MLLFILPNFNAGGAERATVNIANGMVERGYDVQLLVFSDMGPLAEVIHPEIVVHNLRKPRVRSVLFSLIRKIRQLGPTHVFSTLAYVNVTLLAFRFAFQRGVKILIREANMPSLSLSGTLGRRFLRLLCRLMYPTTDLLFVTSGRMRTECVELLGVSAHRIRMLRNPIRLDQIRASIGDVEFGSPNSRKFVAAGRLTHQKGFDRLLEVFSNPAFAEDELLVVGDGNLRNELQGLATSLGISDRVAFLGFQKNPWQVYGSGNVYLMPSRWEGMSNAALEALACGLPVIATPEAGGIADLANICTPSAVTIAAIPEEFLQAMLKTKLPSSPMVGPSLLPPEFEVENVLNTFEHSIQD
ncbi:MAG: glycosyltransferase [Rhizobiaceae bacterium]